MRARAAIGSQNHCAAHHPRRVLPFLAAQTHLLHVPRHPLIHVTCGIQSTSMQTSLKAIQQIGCQCRFHLRRALCQWRSTPAKLFCALSSCSVAASSLLYSYAHWQLHPRSSRAPQLLLLPTTPGRTDKLAPPLHTSYPRKYSPPLARAPPPALQRNFLLLT